MAIVSKEEKGKGKGRKNSKEQKKIKSAARLKITLNDTDKAILNKPADIGAAVIFDPSNDPDEATARLASLSIDNNLNRILINPKYLDIVNTESFITEPIKMFGSQADLLTISKTADLGIISPSPAAFIDPFLHDDELSKSKLELEKQVNSLKEKMRESAKQIKDLISKKQQKNEDLITANEKFKELQIDFNKLEREYKFFDILRQISDEAGNALFNDSDLHDKFKSQNTYKMYVVSMDIRRSTELMLKASSEKEYERFITSLTEKLTTIVKANDGIFDKFTGDGILAFFPHFFTGSGFGLQALITAHDCVKAFSEHYIQHHSSFDTVLMDVGLGIGIDYGDAYIVNMNGSYTVIGKPVVYACRYSSAKAGDILLNQGAKNTLFDKYSEYFDFEETIISLKHEGPALAYKVTWNEKELPKTSPVWKK